ncbi:MAG: redoxin domain-containing protein [Bacteroidota bacterium]
MKKFVLPIALFLVVAIAAFYFIHENVKEKTTFLDERSVPKPEGANPVIPKEKAALPADSLHDLPPLLPLTKLDSTTVLANTLLGKTILIVFLPDCDHCQREAAQIRKHISAFEKYSLWFISSANLAEIKQFGEKYKLLEQANISLAHSEQAYINDSFGYIPTPSLYIYSNGHRIKDFKGETDIKTILAAL